MTCNVSTPLVDLTPTPGLCNNNTVSNLRHDNLISQAMTVNQATLINNNLDKIKENSIINILLNNPNNNIDIKNNKNSSYYTINDYNKLKNNFNELTIISLNINSLKKYINDLTIFINSLKIEPDVIILQETRLNIECMLNESFKDYQYFIDYPNNNKCGGVVILIKNNLNAKLIQKYQITCEGIENVVIEILLNNQSYVISGIYKHPKVCRNVLMNVLTK